MSLGGANLHQTVEIAGGRDMAPFIPGTFGTVAPERITASDPANVVVTGGNREACASGGPWVAVGPGADLGRAPVKLGAPMRRSAFTGIRALESRRVHAIWHQFYNDPYAFAAAQRLASRIHPELFADLDPEAALRSLHERFLPIPYRAAYRVSPE